MMFRASNKIHSVAQADIEKSRKEWSLLQNNDSSTENQLLTTKNHFDRMMVADYSSAVLQHGLTLESIYKSVRELVLQSGPLLPHLRKVGGSCV